MPCSFASPPLGGCQTSLDRSRGGTRSLLSALVLASLAGCAGPSSGSRPDDASAIDGGPTGSPDVGPGSDATAADAGGGDASDPDASTRTDAGSDTDPPPDVPPDVVHHLSLAIRTGAAAADASDGHFEVCVNATDCFPLDVPDVDDFRSGELDVFHFERLDLPRADVRRAELRWRSGSDGWRPVCMEMQLDGEPVYCQSGLDARLGDGAGEARSWRDPMGIHEACATCYPERVTHGPLVGSVGPDDARILVRTDATRPVSLEIVDAAGTRIDVGPRYPRPGNDFTTVFRVTGLSPRTEYTAHVAIGGTRLGRAAHFRTAPREGVSGVFQIGFGSCANDDNFPVQPVFDAIADRSLEMFLFLGDNHYGNTGFTQAHWFRYRRMMEMPARARFLANTPVLATWDDHDFTGNDSTRFVPVFTMKGPPKG